MKKTFFDFLILIFVFSAAWSQQKTVITSPDGNIRVTIACQAEKENADPIKFSVSAFGKTVLLPSSFLLDCPGLNFTNLKKTNTEREKVNNSWINEFGERREIPDSYKEVKLDFSGKSYKFSILCRVYNEGVALAYVFPEQEGLDSVTINDEKFLFRFPGDYTAWSAPGAQAQYRKATISTIDKGCERPLVIEYDTTLIIALAEAKLVDYARMKFEPDFSGSKSIRSRLDGIVKKKIPFQSPWRVVMIGKNAGDLLEKNYLILNLNDPCALDDVSWIRPGKVIREVTLTTSGAMALVDFISRHNMQYIEFDAGWYGYEYDDSSDARSVNVDPRRSKGPLDMQKIISYAHSKDIGVLLYVNRRALERQLDEILPIYREWGISGLKFGFVQVGTQLVTAWMHEAIKKAAAYKMIVDVHDEYRPTGFSRTYPNFLTQEGIRGDEESPPNSHTLITMFTRMLAGAGDNTICYYDRRVDERMGSHASQLAKAVCIFSPLQFIYWYDKCVPEGKEEEFGGKPNYLGDEPELEFFDNVPTTWDETKVLHAVIGEYGVIARRNGEEWFIGGINGEKPHELIINFSFLKPGIKYSARIYSDDPSVNTRTHVRIDTVMFDSESRYTAHLESNRGFAMHLKPEKH